MSIKNKGDGYKPVDCDDRDEPLIYIWEIRLAGFSNFMQISEGNLEKEIKKLFDVGTLKNNDSIQEIRRTILR